MFQLKDSQSGKFLVLKSGGWTCLGKQEDSPWLSIESNEKETVAIMVMGGKWKNYYIGISDPKGSVRTFKEKKRSKWNFTNHNLISKTPGTYYEKKLSYKKNGNLYCHNHKTSEFVVEKVKMVNDVMKRYVVISHIWNRFELYELSQQDDPNEYMKNLKKIYSSVMFQTLDGGENWVEYRRKGHGAIKKIIDAQEKYLPKPNKSRTMTTSVPKVKPRDKVPSGPSIPEVKPEHKSGTPSTSVPEASIRDEKITSVSEAKPPDKVPISSHIPENDNQIRKKQLKKYITKMLDANQMERICLLINKNSEKGAEVGKAITELSNLITEEKKKLEEKKKNQQV